MNNPDAHAWKLFADINRQVPNDPEGRVVWEKWALANDVFANPSQKPDWNALTEKARSPSDLEPLPLQQLAPFARRANVPLGQLRRNSMQSLFDLPAAQQQGNETRMNKPTFDFIVDNDLYYLQGQMKLFRDGKIISFPTASQEIKAQWRRIDTANAALFHTASVKLADGSTQIWGLTALHITTKDLPNWFWATWEHKSNPRRELIVPSVDRAGLPNELKGTKWENYILRGTQVDFTTGLGKPTILANSQIEEGFEATSSCITCHARSTIREAQPLRLDIFEPDGNGSVGSPKPEWFFGDDDKLDYAQLDFVWSLFRAMPRP